MAYAILVIWLDGEEEYLKTGARPDGELAVFPNRERAEEMRDFMMEGMADEVQSINVIPVLIPRTTADEGVATA